MVFVCYTISKSNFVALYVLLYNGRCCNYTMPSIFYFKSLQAMMMIGGMKNFSRHFSFSKGDLL